MTIPAQRHGQSVDEFAEDLGVSRVTIYKEMGDGRLRSIKIRGRRIIPADARQEYLDARRDEAES